MRIYYIPHITLIPNDDQYLMTNPYDEIPYLSHAFSDSHPDRLATMATIFGMRPANIQHCSVLELGCASGGNIMPMAEQLPHSTFTGIDYSQVQIDQGQDRIDELGLTNITLTNMDIMDLDDNFGMFDYIIAHGVYSWVPKNIKEKVMEVCARHLNPQGVAYVSYNVYPGWHLFGIVRDIMLYGAKDHTLPADRLEHARKALELVTESVSTDTPYGKLLFDKWNSIKSEQDYYLFHEFLEEDNNPVYFHEFVAHASQQNLQFLCDLGTSVTELSELTSNQQDLLHASASNTIEIEQHMDFINNRTLRKTLLCHQEIQLDRENLANQIMNLHVRSQAKPESTPVNVNSAETITFKSPVGRISTNNPLIKSILVQLVEGSPATHPVAEILKYSEPATHQDCTPTSGKVIPDETREVLQFLYEFDSSGHIEFSTQPSLYATRAPDKPEVTRLNRLQARKGEPVFNLRHRRIPLTEFQAFILQLLDGKTDHAMIHAVLLKHARNGYLTLKNDKTGIITTDPDGIDSNLSAMITNTLDYFTNMALLR